MKKDIEELMILLLNTENSHLISELHQLLREAESKESKEQQLELILPRILGQMKIPVYQEPYYHNCVDRLEYSREEWSALIRMEQFVREFRAEHFLPQSGSMVVVIDPHGKVLVDPSSFGPEMAAQINELDKVRKRPEVRSDICVVVATDIVGSQTPGLLFLQNQESIENSFPGKHNDVYKALLKMWSYEKANWLRQELLQVMYENFYQEKESDSQYPWYWKHACEPYLYEKDAEDRLTAGVTAALFFGYTEEMFQKREDLYSYGKMSHDLLRFGVLDWLGRRLRRIGIHKND